LKNRPASGHAEVSTSGERQRHVEYFHGRGGTTEAGDMADVTGRASRHRATSQRRGKTATAKEEPESPIGLSKTSWKGVLRRALREYKEDNLSDWAAALTYRAILALFPGLLVLVAVVGLLGKATSDKLLNNLQKHAPGSVQSTLQKIFENAQSQHGAAGLIGIVSLLVALWSASGYVAAFMRASNNIYDIGEGRPFWKTTLIRVGLTVFLVVAVIIAAAIAVLSGRIANDVGNAIGLGHTAVNVWNIAKWPLLVVIASLTLAVLYWAAPNARLAGFRWITPGGLLAVLIWAAASAGFAVYVANFASYNKTYGSLAGIVIFLIWLWISNIALLLGAEFDAELLRARAIDGGLPEDQEPYVDLRDTRKLDPAQRQRAEALSRELRSE
jgi:membrane protein